MNNSINKKITLVVALSVIVLPMHAESIVTISGQKVMGESETGKAVQFKLQEKQRELASPLQTEEKKIQKLEEKLIADKETLEKDFAELEKAGKMLSAEQREQQAEAVREKAIKFEDQKRELERSAQKLQVDARKVEAKMQELYQKEMAKMDMLVKETIKELAQKHNWDIVFMEESVVYSNPKLSKTPLVAEALDAKTKALNQAKKQTITDTELKKAKTDVKKELAAHG